MAMGLEKEGQNREVCREAIGFGDSLDCGENSKGKGGVEDDFRKPSEM